MSQPCIIICNSINDIKISDWNALVLDNNPFLQHEFLSALETCECVGKRFGWVPCHITIYIGDSLIAAMPLYEKFNSYGEFVFDNSWAEAYHRYGFKYFPKLVSSIPYTPAQGQRILCTEENKETLYPLFFSTIKNIIEEKKLSSFHCLFPQSDEFKWLKKQNLICRYDCQFHWFNHDYENFNDFISTFSSRKRKNILKERRLVNDSGVTFRVLDGHDATNEDWVNFTSFYQKTFDEKWGTATLNKDFFVLTARSIPDHIVLVLADRNGKCIAGSLMYRSRTTLYGRFWGCVEDVDFLHFEACYYQGIDFCIKHNINKFEPGAQGEHKIARGFIPCVTRSSHYLSDNPLIPAIEAHSVQEKLQVQNYMKDLYSHLPYKNTLVLNEADFD